MIQRMIDPLGDQDHFVHDALCRLAERAVLGEGKRGGEADEREAEGGASGSTERVSMSGLFSRTVEPLRIPERRWSGALARWLDSQAA